MSSSLPCRFVRMVLVGGEDIVLANGQPHIAFNPGGFVEPMVMIARRRHRNLVEVGIGEHRPTRGVTAGRMSKDAHAGDIQIVVSDRLAVVMALDVIGQAIVRQVAIAMIVAALWIFPACPEPSIITTTNP